MQRRLHTCFREGIVEQNHPWNRPVRAGRLVAAYDGGQFIWYGFQLAQTVVVLGDAHGHAAHAAHLRLILEVPAGHGNHDVSIAFHQVLFAVVKGRQRHVAQHILERPDQRLRVRSLKILLDRSDQNVVKVLRLRQNVFFRSVSRQGPREREHFAAQRDPAYRYFARHSGGRGNHDHHALVVKDCGVDCYRPGAELSRQSLKAGGPFIDGFHAGVGVVALAEAAVQVFEKCLKSLVRRGQPSGQFVVPVFLVRGPGGFPIELRPFVADGRNLVGNPVVFLVRLVLRRRARNGVGILGSAPLRESRILLCL